MNWLTRLNARLSRWAMYVAVAALLGITALVLWGVVMRYVFHNAPPYVEQLALILVISVAMFAASAGVREAGHIGMDSLVVILPKKVQFIIGVIVGLLSIAFGVVLFAGSLQMALAVYSNMIPTLDISEAVRYAPCVIAGVLIVLFSIEHLIAMFTGKEVEPSWY
ncbi:MAG: C4-dicarboxylate ABC transporter permease [Candidatus Dactylopiibacterium carminicum]|uniref:TRAP transporter small permease protein n=1 Tax=Candidatus Dactylopiibacterium carminicum TaxID=857335 RepID=A0A272EYJ5_9RHOO|nr:TRAP transporter small permease [Candidatus Dactylopiibacterium carminicum]KAF7600258.1 TRAP transporter small permease [Candidatus Dactylopiibacterium carminicum]PAS94690.1 MAG: C4-dicarboxylate ABC transporter permease [Candidatus Dactylopiibacterium carminicum]PAS96977.1 MAG: C4-dicarboxylate ABC transporter permease [Candidatus Dactylopiibacterium carminicum]PAT00257.1 MAG: C4-dicarboxylate ABC transporter permease [Candidatus Dactylopiibacterium carminicum]